MHNLAGWRSTGSRPTSAGSRRATTRWRSASTRPHGELLVDGEVVGRGEIKRTIWSRFSLTGAGLTAGLVTRLLPRRRGLPRPLRVHGGTLHHVDIDVDGDAVIDPEAAIRDAFAAE